MNREMIRLIIFDMDGVILDSEPLHERARNMIFERLGIMNRENLPDPVGKSAAGFWKQVLKECNMEEDSCALEEEQFKLVALQIEEDKIPASDGLMEVFSWAKNNGWKIALASSSAKMLVDETLSLLGIKEYFDYIVSGSEVENKKPAPDVYLKVLKLSGIPAEQAIAIEDSCAGVAAARRAGIFCYGYSNETSGGQDISEADMVIGNLKEMIVRND